MSKNNISVVLPVYNEEAALSETIKEIKSVMNNLNCSYEIIFYSVQ